MLLGEILRRKNWLDGQQLELALMEQNQTQQKLGEILLKAELISRQQLTRALQEQYWRKKGFWVIEAMDRPIINSKVERIMN
jgi:hypothetical protein